MRWTAAPLAMLLSVSVFAQVDSRPTDPPTITAETQSWYRLGEPVLFSGDFYDPTGPQVFFDGNVMVRTGYHNGVPLYVDATVEPYSVVLVPVGRKLMQPYKRRASRGMVNGAGTPSNPLQPPGPISELAPRAVGTSGRVTTPDARPVDVVGTAVTQPRRGRPVRYDSISVEFRGEKWVMAGPSVPLLTGLVKIAEHGGVPVYAEKDSERQRIYLTFTPGRVVPFTPKQ